MDAGVFQGQTPTVNTEIFKGLMPTRTPKCMWL